MQFTIPLYNSGVTRARAQAARQDEEQSRINLEQIRHLISLDVLNALTRIETASKAHEVALKGQDLATESLRLAQIRYDEGAGILLDVTTAQSELTRAQGSVVTAKYQYLTAIAALQAATGTDLFGNQIDPVNVLYTDHEMTEDDVEERLLDFEYGPDTDLTHLAYSQFPVFPPLDTEAGGEALEAAIAVLGVELVVIDTLSKIVEGEENNSDTYLEIAVDYYFTEQFAAGVSLEFAGDADVFTIGARWFFQ